MGARLVAGIIAKYSDTVNGGRGCPLDRCAPGAARRPGAGREERTLRGPQGLVFSVAFSPDGARLAAGWSDGTVRCRSGRPGQAFLDRGPPAAAKRRTRAARKVAGSP